MQTLEERRALKKLSRPIERIHEHRDALVWVIIVALGIVLGFLW